MECSWEHVTAKSEIPIMHAGEVPFPTLEEIRARKDEVCDYNYFFCKKVYGVSPEAKNIEMHRSCVP